MSKIIPPHGGGELRPLLLDEAARREELERAKGLKKLPMTSRETSDLIMMGIGAFTPLEGFMGQDDWRGCCETFTMPTSNSLFWPIPITLSAEEDCAKSIAPGEEVALWDTETESIMGTMKVTEKYAIDKDYECQQVFRTNDPAHPGRAEGHGAGRGEPRRSGEGALRVLLSRRCSRASISGRPKPARAFAERGWSTVAALQLRNPMHNSHAYLAWIAIEVCDGVYIHQLVGKLKPGDIPAEVRVQSHRRAGQQVFPQRSRHPGRIPHGNALRRAARSPAARRVPPELRLHAPDRGPRPRRRGRLLRPLRRAEDLQRNSRRRPAAAAAVHGLDLLLLRMRHHGVHEDLPAREQGRDRREGQLQGRRAPAAVRARCSAS